MQRLGMERPVLTERDGEWIERLADEDRAVPLIAELPVAEGHAIRAHVVHGRSYDEIADATDSSAVAVRKRVSRGLARVRKQLESRQ